MGNKYLIGMDGGGTKTKCVITNYNFNPLHECQGGPSNFLIIGTEQVSETILSLILESTAKLNISTDDITSILIGTTGAGRENDANKLRDDFISYAKSKGYIFNSFNVESDARIAIEGAFSGNAGALLIAGTGSIIFGKDKNNNVHRAGGYGRLLGDEGSGYSIGRKGLIETAKNFDGRNDSTLLTQLLNKDFEISSGAQLISQVYNNNFDIASFAPKVIEAASIGDSLAIRILEEESDELIFHVRAMYKKLGEETMELCLVGGIISSKNYYSALFREKIKLQLPEVRIVEARFSPEIGAAIMAKSKL
jgi:N-acetylglucosamine kinase-like BadF-type ATPase